MKNVLKIFSVAILLLMVIVSCKKEVNVTGVTLDKQSITLTVGAMETLTATVQPDNATNKAVSWTSDNTTVADVSNGVVTAKVAGTVTITVTTNDGNYTAKCTVAVTPVVEPEKEWVEINGIKWAKRNVDMPGTFAAKPEDTGMLYQWNRKTGWSATNPMINSDGGTTWDNTDADGDTWAKANDPCPTGWRVPTHEEQESLENSASEWTTLNGVTGRVFGSGNNTLFLPAAGSRNYSGSITYVGTYGYYWSSTPTSTTDAYNMFFYSSNVSTYYRTNRAYGFSVRCVAE